jgi:hypothetical protein
MTSGRSPTPAGRSEEDAPKGQYRNGESLSRHLQRNPSGRVPERANSAVSPDARKRPSRAARILLWESLYISTQSLSEGPVVAVWLNGHLRSGGAGSFSRIDQVAQFL